MDGVTLRFGRAVHGAGGVKDVVLCTAEDGREFAVLASEWPSQLDQIATRKSSAAQKITLFRSLFVDGRMHLLLAICVEMGAWNIVPRARICGSPVYAIAAM